MSDEIRHLAVLGHPIAHSLSPVLHEAAYSQLGLPWRYDRADVASGELRAFLQGLDDSWLGLSLTMPLKREIVPLLAGLTDVAQELGVVNTVRFDRVGMGAGRRGSARQAVQLIGANTDVWGIEQALRDAAIGAADTIDIVGAGATALSVARAIYELGGRHLRIHARAPERAAELVEHAESWGIGVDLVPLTTGEIEFAGPAVVSTLPAHAADAIEPRHEPGSVLLDVSYDPWPSRLAEAWQGTVVSGVEMLLWQAVAQVRFFVLGDDREPVPNEDQVIAAMREALASVDTAS